MVGQKLININFKYFLNLMADQHLLNQYKCTLKNIPRGRLSQFSLTKCWYAFGMTKNHHKIYEYGWQMVEGEYYEIVSTSGHVFLSVISSRFKFVFNLNSSKDQTLLARIKCTKLIFWMKLNLNSSVTINILSVLSLLRAIRVSHVIIHEKFWL